MSKLTIEYYKNGLKTIKRYLAPHRREVVALAVLSLVLAIGDALVPYLGGKLFDAILGKIHSILLFSRTWSPFVVIIGFWIVVELLTDIAGRFKNVRQESLTAILESDYIVNGLSKLLRFPMSFHKQHKIGEVTERITRAANWLQNLIGRIIIDLAPQFFSIAIAIVITFTIKIELAAILLVAVLIYTLILLRTAPKLSVFSHRMHKAYSRAYGDAYDSILNVQSVKQATAEHYERSKLYRNFHLRAAKVWTDYIRVSSNLNFSERILVTITRFSLFIVSLYFIGRGKMTPGELVAFNGYAAMLFGPFAILGRNWDTIQNGLAAIARAEKLITLPEEEYSPPGALVPQDILGKVEFKDVSFRYDKNKQITLKHISFVVNPGESVALVGESGVGKSTLTDLISLYHHPMSGKILVDDKDLSTLDLVTLRSFIAVVSQEIILFNDTVKNNIKYGKFGASDEDVIRAAKMAHAHEFIEAFPKKYETLVGERGVKLSVGQKQRLAIARAILRDPKILILDEPTSALDARSERFIQESLEKLMRGRTTFIIAHRLSTVRKADKILVLQDKEIVEIGKHDELIQKPNGVYRKLYDLQMGFK